MLKFIGASFAVAVLTFASPVAAQAAGHGRCAAGGPVYQAAPQYQAAAPSGYRSFSYEPGATAYYGQTTTRRYSSSRPSYFDATSKALGRYGK